MDDDNLNEVSLYAQGKLRKSFPDWSWCEVGRMVEGLTVEGRNGDLTIHLRGRCKPGRTTVLWTTFISASGSHPLEVCANPRRGYHGQSMAEVLDDLRDCLNLIEVLGVSLSARSHTAKPHYAPQSGARFTNRFVGECWVWSYDEVSNQATVGYWAEHQASGEDRVFFRTDPFTVDFFTDMGEHDV